MESRRSFISKSVSALAGVAVAKNGLSFPVDAAENKLPVVVSTWKHGLPANDAAWKILSKGGYALDAVEAGVRVPEGDPKVHSVGYGAVPDANGKVTLDASIMNEKGNAGSVSFLRCIKHPISVARLIMEQTPHVMLSGKGAQKFALKNGFQKEKLLTKEMKSVWKNWKKEGGEFKPRINIEKLQNKDHDTIGMLAMDKDGRICGACTTSGLAFKMFGRVGDSPIIGSGMFVDEEVGGAVATGTGELVMKTLGTFLVVEMMRNGMSPKKACEEAVMRIARKIPDYENHQVGYIALDKSGNYGAFSIQPGFEYAVKSNEQNELLEAEAWLKKL